VHLHEIQFPCVACTILWGEMSEWFKELVLKTSDVARHRGFESLSLRHFKALGLASPSSEKLNTSYGSRPLGVWRLHKKSLSEHGEVPKLAEGAPLLRV
jgi:hypothetical protein